nr:hypothetical protein [uncultured Clostridium sp.]
MYTYRKNYKGISLCSNAGLLSKADNPILKNLIILILDGRMFVPLDKNGFIGGEAESCKKFIDGKIRK